jgi:predicted RNA-binding protein YlxR (DUF448 family)
MLTQTQVRDLDRGARNATSGRSGERTCALTRATLLVDSLIRFVISPEGGIVPDIKRKLPGRGLWITATQTAVTEAAARKVFARGFKRDVHVPVDLATQTDRLLARSALDALAISGKSGAVRAGLSKAEAAIANEDVMALIHASDAANDGLRKLTSKVVASLRHETAEKSREIAIIKEFSGAQLDLALGRPNVVHAALLAGPVSGTFVARAMRLKRFRTGHSLDAASASAPMDGARGQDSE